LSKKFSSPKSQQISKIIKKQISDPGKKHLQVVDRKVQTPLPNLSLRLPLMLIELSGGRCYWDGEGEERRRREEEDEKGEEKDEKRRREEEKGREWGEEEKKKMRRGEGKRRR
jgi:hypothetical protein